MTRGAWSAPTNTGHTMTDEQLTILVVDDEREIADLYSMWLDSNYEVRTAYDGPEALAAVDESVDIVFLDRRMPEMTGDEVLAEIRERGLDCCVVLMTAVDPDFDIVDLDFDEYLTKPVVRDDIQGAIETLRERDTSTESSRKYHALVAKKETLEAEKTESALDRSEAYRELVERVEELDPDADTAQLEVETEFEFRELDG